MFASFPLQVNPNFYHFILKAEYTNFLTFQMLNSFHFSALNLPSSKVSSTMLWLFCVPGQSLVLCYHGGIEVIVGPPMNQYNHLSLFIMCTAWCRQTWEESSFNSQEMFTHRHKHTTQKQTVSQTVTLRVAQTKLRVLRKITRVSKILHAIKCFLFCFCFLRNNGTAHWPVYKNDCIQKI